MRLLMHSLLLLPFHAFSQFTLDDFALTVRGASREFAYTNKQDAFFYGETNARNTSGWQGFNVSGFEFLDDYVLLANGEPLDRSTAETTVYPDHLVRTYPDGIIEQLRIVDSVALFGLMVTSPRAVELAIIPYFTDGRNADYYDITLGTGTALIARKNHLRRSPTRNHPVWLAVHSKNMLPQIQDSVQGMQYSPVALSGGRSKTHIISVAVADEAEVAAQLAQTHLANAAKYFRERRARMEKLLSETRVVTEDKRFNDALAWAKLSLDALIMNQGTKGIFAGLPWFNNYWGRDTFIALPGATLVTGRFDEARAILQSFARFQQTDSLSSDYGRIPNIVTTTERGYNTADGTPRFVMMAREYVERSGDSTFILEVYPTVLRAIEGTVKYHTDEHGFLTHEDAETWMDAVGPKGPWSPRGNRANDIQALWVQQLDAGAWFATRIGDVTSARYWTELRDRAKAGFLREFVHDGRVADRLLPDGSRDMRVRPNQLFTLPLLPDSLRALVTQTVATKLTYRHGVASLSQDDEDFHPYHLHELYPKDAAYHNGVVWTWLQGALISELCRFGKQDFAYWLTANSVGQILDRGAVGTQSELLDAAPRPGESEPALSGTFSQAWNLAEFVRNFYDDYLGVRIARYDHTITLRPRLPQALGNVSATLNLNGRAVPLEISTNTEPQVISIDGRNLRVGGKAVIELTAGSGYIVRTSLTLPPRGRVTLAMADTTATVLINDRPAAVSTRVVAPKHYEYLEQLEYAVPQVGPDLRSWKGPDHTILVLDQVRAINDSAEVLFSADDPVGDDTGNGSYSYPANPHFVPGCLDMTSFTVRHDDRNAYFRLQFRALANPGWHPEYGFQLTFAAIAIDTNGVTGLGRSDVPHNAMHMLDPRHAYERLILVGGGVQVEDSSGTVLAAYLPRPADVRDPIGNAAAGTITFAIPLQHLGRPQPHWTFTVLVGGQDDHGGAGLGEFRSVRAERSEWAGGGKADPRQANVYDTLIVGGR